MPNESFRKIMLMSAVLIFTIALILIFSFSVDPKTEYTPESIAQDSPQKEILKIIPTEIPSHITFAGESVPLQLQHVWEGLDRELLVNNYWHSSTILMLKRANRWFPVIEPILEQQYIPDDFKYLALIESGFTRAVSPKGAAGFWQFLDKTAREYGLEVNEFVDERYNVELSTIAACRYFRESFAEYKNWTLVAAAFNAGKRRISESLEKQQVNNFYDLFLNEETSRYPYRILALKAICENQQQFGFYLEPDDLYQQWKTEVVEVSGPITDLVDFAKKHNITYRTLKDYNPWLRSDRLPNNSGKVYRIKVSAAGG
jgi:membrane-bound lytic murein transglycosylase D